LQKSRAYPKSLSEKHDGESDHTYGTKKVKNREVTKNHRKKDKRRKKNRKTRRKKTRRHKDTPNGGNAAGRGDGEGNTLSKN